MTTTTKETTGTGGGAALAPVKEKAPPKTPSIKVTLPAMAGMMGSYDVFQCMVPLTAIPQLFDPSKIDVPWDQREQRPINERRIPEILEYLQQDGWVFAPLVASVKAVGKNDFTYVLSDGDGARSSGLIELDLGKVSVTFHDGQHRAMAIVRALAAKDEETGEPLYPDLRDQSIGIQLHRWISVDRSRQIFSDLNSAVKPHKSLVYFFNARDEAATAAKEVEIQVDALTGAVEMEHTSVPQKDKEHLISLTALRDGTATLWKESYEEPDAVSLEEKTRLAVEFWGRIAKLCLWERAREAGFDLYREGHVSAHGSVLQGIATAGGRAIKKWPKGWSSRLAPLGKVDWRKSNKEWETAGVMAGGSVYSTPGARKGARDFLLRQLGLWEEESTSEEGSTTSTTAGTPPNEGKGTTRKISRAAA